MFGDEESFAVIMQCIKEKGVCAVVGIDGVCTRVVMEQDSPNRLKQLSRAVGGRVEKMPSVTTYLTLLMDAERHEKVLPANRHVSMLDPFMNNVFGTVVVVRTSDISEEGVVVPPQSPGATLKKI
jgi:hypothetical protein